MIRIICTIALSLAAAMPSTGAGDQPNQHHFPFKTLQPDGAIIALTYKGDDEFNWYEDAEGYTVVNVRGEYRYASLGSDGLLAPTPHRVGVVRPANAGLTPHTLPSPKMMARLREKSRAIKAEQVIPVNDRIPPDSTLIDGCILVKNSALSDDHSGQPAGAQGAASITSGFWPGGVIYYAFDGAVTTPQRDAMLEAMHSWEAVANVQFVLRSSQVNYIYIFSGSGNWSYVGMIGGRQDLSIYNWDYKFIMMHELAHALGVWHEQSRPDRDGFVQINSGNILSGTEGNFDIQAGASTNGDYDFDSIMHYGQCAFANCTCSSSCRTITCLHPNEAWQDQIGQKTHLSVGDAENMALLYGEPNVAGMATMTTPASDGVVITGGGITFHWSAGSGVSDYRLTVGSGDGLTDYHDSTGTATSASVSGLPNEGGSVHVRLYSKIGGNWYFHSYTYSTDLCPGHPDNVDSDGDGVPDGCDICVGENDSADADNDGVPDGCDLCPNADDTADADADGIPDACDQCPNGADNLDSDNDGTPDGCDACPDADNNIDSDDDGTPDCLDGCPNNADKSDPGICGCDVPDTDSDNDGTPDCNDNCPFDAGKLEPGVDGCNADDSQTGGGVLGVGPTGGTPGFDLCGGGSASAVSTMMLSVLCLRGRGRRRRLRSQSTTAR